jgi:hypothetical protein
MFQCSCHPSRFSCPDQPVDDENILRRVMPGRGLRSFPEFFPVYGGDRHHCPGSARPESLRSDGEYQDVVGNHKPGCVGRVELLGFNGCGSPVFISGFPVQADQIRPVVKIDRPVVCRKRQWPDGIFLLPLCFAAGCIDCHDAGRFSVPGPFIPCFLRAIPDIGRCRCKILSRLFRPAYDEKERVF